METELIEKRKLLQKRFDALRSQLISEDASGKEMSKIPRKYRETEMNCLGQLLWLIDVETGILNKDAQDNN